MIQKLLFFVAFFYAATSFAQPASYTTANAHSHNDYTQSAPFFSAYYAQFGSIEVDIFFEKDAILVAHTDQDLSQSHTLEEMYLKPLQTFIQTNHGSVYADTSRKLQLYLDVKTDAPSTLTKLLEILQKYPTLTNCNSLKFVISGRKPDPETYTYYPKYIWFDGLLSEKYSKTAMSRIVMLTDNFLNYTKWKGDGPAPANDWAAIKKVVDRAHALGKTVRFWNTPDFMDVWELLTKLGVDYINSDSIKSLAAFLKTRTQS